MFIRLSRRLSKKNENGFSANYLRLRLSYVGFCPVKL